MARRQKPPQANQRLRKRRRGQRAGIGQQLLDVHHRSKALANRKGNRRQGMSRQAAIAGTPIDLPVEYDEYHLPLTRRVIHSLIGLALIPLCLITAITLFQRVKSDHFMLTFWYSIPFFDFMVGVFLMLSWFVCIKFTRGLLYLYVLGHEMTHAMFVYLCGGWVADLKATPDGGYILTNKSNIVIALSPYFVPFWTLVIISAYNFIQLYYPHPVSERFLIGAIGFTWSFHIIWTVWMILKGQPDLRENGIFFSFMIILLVNLIILGVLFCITSSELNFADFSFYWWNNVLDCLEAIRRSFVWLH